MTISKPVPQAKDPFLSAVELQINSQEFHAILAPYAGDDEFKAFREDPNFFAYRRRESSGAEEVLLIPLSTNASGPAEGTAACLPVSQFRRALGTLVERRLPELLPSLGLEPQRFGPKRLKRDEDLVAVSLTAAKLRPLEVLIGVSKHIRTRFQVRTEFIPGRGSLILMAIEFSVATTLTRSINQLVSDGVSLEGLRVTRNDKEAYIISARGDSVRVECEDGVADWILAEVSLTASPEAISRIFSNAFTDLEFNSFRQAEAKILSDRLSGAAYVERLRSTARWLKQKGDLEIAPGLRFTFGDLLTLPRRSPASALTKFEAIKYCFSRDRTALSTLPSEGLEKFGPADGETFDKKEPQFLILYPDGERTTAENFFRSLREGLRNSRAYSRGFTATYRLSRCDCRFLPVRRDASPADPSQAYLQALKNGFDPSTHIDAAIVLLRDDDGDLPDSTNPYVATKAWLLSQGIPSQEIRLGKAKQGIGNLQYILQDLAVALYAKIGGSPWTVLPSTPIAREIVLGIAYSELSKGFRNKSRFMGIATVFSADGTYILGASSPQCTYEEYPTVLGETLRGTIRRLAADQRWSRGDLVRLIVHMGKTLTRSDISVLSQIAFSELVEGIQFESAFLNIRQDHPFTLLDPSQSGREQWVERLDGRDGKATVGQAVPERGTVVDLGRGKRLLCVTGPQQLKREGSAPPKPLLIELHRDSTYTELTSLTRQVFQFTGLSWRSVRPISEPVTLSYSRLIARLVARLSTHSSWSPDLMNTHLLRSRWFL